MNGVCAQVHYKMKTKTTFLSRKITLSFKPSIEGDISLRENRIRSIFI